MPANNNRAIIVCALEFFQIVPNKFLSDKTIINVNNNDTKRKRELMIIKQGKNHIEFVCELQGRVIHTTAIKAEIIA